MLAKPVIAAALLCFGTAPVWAQSPVARADAKDQRAIQYRDSHCASGNEAACGRADAKDRRAIGYRDQHATAEQRDPDAALDRANAKDARSIAYRNAHCPPTKQAACARADAKTRRAMAKRDPDDHY